MEITMKQNNSVLSFEELQKKLQVCLDHGFKTYSITQRREALKKQRKRINSSEECFSTTSEQLARQFSL